VSGEHLLDAALVLGLAFHVVQILHQQVTDGVRWLEFQRQDSLGCKDAHQHLHALN
jgi:hypothetical protein